MTDQPHLILGTAGHIDHGKTTLITLLTGTNTDRLQEERDRGISIELGYAELRLPSGQRLSVVDVPGHERFVRTMVAGATGVDLFLLTVAADDGVMPQTVEHLAILDLLGVERGVVALTKADLVDEELLELARADVESFLRETRYVDSPIVVVSARDGRGVPQLLGALEEAAAHIQTRRASGPARLPVDRVFALTGIGTVATGTLWRGEVRAGDSLAVQPGGARVTVRSVQVHDRAAPTAQAGQRVGLNIRGAERAGLERGRWLAAPTPAARVTRVFDGWLTTLPGVKGSWSGSQWRLHHGTSQYVARVQPLTSVEAAPSGGATEGRTRPGEPARVRLDRPALLEPGDRFILRTLSPAATVGGGAVLDADVRRWRARDAHAEYVAALAQGDEGRAAVLLAGAAGPRGVTSADLAATSVSQNAASVLRRLVAQGQLEALVDSGEPREAPDAKDEGTARTFVPGLLDRLQEVLLTVLETRAVERPERPEASATELADRLAAETAGPVSRQVVAALASRLVAAGQAVRTESGYASAGAGVLDADGEGLAAAALSVLQREPFAPPTLAALVEELAAPRRKVTTVLDVLVRRGAAVRVREDLWFTAEAVDTARVRLRERLEVEGEVTIAGYRDELRTGRRNAQALLEHFDGEGLTRRVGDRRIMRRGRR